ncbi:alpha/beta fold hydrolase [Actinoplanes sp. N902-109]|uniref:alpha/beta fold hydrolase n=1 Tax=Actinoplanes sp. (strain N902-109) TaxID=649831 RepID=UPI0018DC8C43|nr:alpha/beta hydrolase [Actinoplanes sp. N902-109]
MSKARFVAVLAAVAAVAAGCAGAPVASAGAEAGPAVTADTLAALVDCPQLPSLPTARCGQITVPRDRSRPAAGTLDIAFALVPHTDTTRPGLGTLVPNPGGPGTSTIDVSGAAFADALHPLLDRRDLLLIDPRGVGRSTPLSCPALTGPARVFASLHRQRQLIGECGRQLGDRIDEYATTAVADDIDAVRATLGLSRLDLFGVSYGTYLMPTYAQRHPQHVRSITLAGAYAVNVDTTGAVGAAAFRRAMTLVCSRTGECSGTRVIADLATLLRQLRAHPEHLDVTFRGTTHHVVLDDWEMTSVAARLFSSRPDTTAQLALAAAVTAARHGDRGPVRKLVRDSLRAQADVYSYGPIALSDAQQWTTSCHDYLRAFSYADSVPERTRAYQAALAGQHDADFAPFTADAWTSRADFDAGACLNWPDDPTARAPFGPGAKLPDVPVLVLNGDLDANTPIASGRAAAAQFPRARFVEVPGAGHTPASTPAGAAAMVQFIRDLRG